MTSPYRERAVDRVADIWADVGRQREGGGTFVNLRCQEVVALLKVAEAALSIGTAPGSSLDLAIGELGATRR